MDLPRSAPASTLALLLIAQVALAGCLAADPLGGTGGADLPDDGPAFDPQWAQNALAFGDGHDHAEAAHHVGMTTPNFEVLGHDPLVSDDYGTTPPGNLCGDAMATDDGRRLAAVESRGDVAFTLVDVTNATGPKKLGELIMRTTYVYDMAVVPDGEHIVLITDIPKQPHNGPVGLLSGAATGETGLAWRSPCTGGRTVPIQQQEAVDEWVPQAPMVLLVDITDPAQPTVVDRHPALGLGHSIHATEADGRTWVLASSVGLTTATSIFQFLEVAETPAGDRLVPLSVYDHAVQDPAEATRDVGHTDGWIQVHPKTNRTVAYLVAWDSGLIMLDVTEPRTPQVLGQWDADYDPDQPADATGNVHSAHPIDGLWDGRHFTVIGPEMGGKPTEDRATGIMYVIDTTDPARPEAVGGWTLPHDVPWDGRLQFSTHYLTVHDRTAFISLYHAGVWAVDLGVVTPGNWTRLPSVGVFMPVNETGAMPDPMFRWTPTLEEALSFDDGTLVTFDSNTGVWTFRFDAQHPAPWPEPTVEIREPGA